MTALDLLIHTLGLHPAENTPRSMLRDELIAANRWTQPEVESLVRTYPGNDGLRLLAADVYESEGDEGRAEWVRDATTSRATWLTTERFWRWFGGTLNDAWPSKPTAVIRNGDVVVVNYAHRPTEPGDLYNPPWSGPPDLAREYRPWTMTPRRGFIESVAIPWADWAAYGDDLCVAPGWCLQSVEFTTPPDPKWLCGEPTPSVRAMLSELEIRWPGIVFTWGERQDTEAIFREATLRAVQGAVDSLMARDFPDQPSPRIAFGEPPPTEVIFTASGPIRQGDIVAPAGPGRCRTVRGPQDVAIGVAMHDAGDLDEVRVRRRG